MKPFDLERALAGDPVITRCGFKVDQLYLFNSSERRTLYGVLHDPEYNSEIYNWPIGGIFCNTEENRLDLFMGVKKKKLWIGISKEATTMLGGNHHVSTHAYTSLEELKADFNVDDYILKEIEIEE